MAATSTKADDADDGSETTKASDAVHLDEEK
jgi:hypothetical protein